MASVSVTSFSRNKASLIWRSTSASAAAARRPLLAVFLRGFLRVATHFGGSSLLVESLRRLRFDWLTSTLAVALRLLEFGCVRGTTSSVTRALLVRGRTFRLSTSSLSTGAPRLSGLFLVEEAAKPTIEALCDHRKEHRDVTGWKWCRGYLQLKSCHHHQRYVREHLSYGCD